MHWSSVIKPSNNQIYILSEEDRTRIYQLLNDLDSDQLRLLLTKHLQNPSLSNDMQNYTHAQLFQECFSLVNNSYTVELGQTLHALRQQRYSSDYFQQQSVPNFRTPFNQDQTRFFTHTAMQHNGRPNIIVSASPVMVQHLRMNRPNLNHLQPISNNDPRSSHQQAQRSTYITSILARPLQIRSSSPSVEPIVNNSLTTVLQQYQIPLLPAPSCIQSSTSSSRQTPILPAPSNAQNLTFHKITFKNLPFYHTITCVHERNHIFHYDSYRKQFTAHDAFILPVDICNQLSLSYDYISDLNIHTTSKCLLLRLARIDQPPAFNGQYEDNLPPNLTIVVNGHTLSNLPTPKASTRQQTDLIRAGREIDITPHIMFNPILKNEITITWSYHTDNTSLHIQYVNAKYALHIYLVERLTVEKLCDKITNKIGRFYRHDSVKLLANARAKDGDLGLEVSDQKLKLICPIDQRLLRKPIRATTCQHLQCFDLTNYIALNEKSNKWMCPVCNKPALFDDLQIDLHTEAILNSIKNENITEITIKADLDWKPVMPIKTDDESVGSSSAIRAMSSSNDIIYIDDDD
ncbi:unnamed protein product [Rotaria socialis]|uniref:SP-RING-type domain-containing protein n=1 Tax=Rotaria socialis TaxID=392032 RepID=A0A820FAW2_9BILA|nr:unnamed protein product [Rotaria socialis]CAF3212409.1 unnamed protein product [Rotaria socialis]CAF4127581.1 unnamed protein product [Rotaria socialis]CAF4259335.1 unnamed protein product [Rotaria socialis]